MGTRTVYEITIDDGTRRPAPAAVLFSNSSHPGQDPRTTFREDAEAAGRTPESGPDQAGSLTGPTGLLESLLSALYAEAGGNHRAGDRLFALVSAPYGDFETVMTAHFDGLGVCTVTERSTERVADVPDSAADAFASFAENQGRDDASMLAVVAGFIEEHGLVGALEDHLQAEADLQNGVDGEGLKLR